MAEGRAGSLLRGRGHSTGEGGAQHLRGGALPEGFQKFLEEPREGLRCDLFPAAPVKGDRRAV